MKKQVYKDGQPDPERKTSTTEFASKTSSPKPDKPLQRGSVQIPNESLKHQTNSRLPLSFVPPIPEKPSKEFNSFKWIKLREFNGKPRSSDFLLHNEMLPILKPGEILTCAICWTINPSQRIDNIPLGSVMPGEQLASVIKSNNLDFPARSLVVTTQGWRSKSVLDPEETFCRIIPDGYSPLLCMNMLGLTGLMYFFGFMEVCGPFKGQVVVVNSGCNYVGELVGQLAKAEECTVILFTNSAASAHWLRCTGFKYVYNYSKLCPTAVIQQILDSGHIQGIDIFIDIVGSRMSRELLPFMKPSTRTVIFGNPDARSSTQATDPDAYRFTSIYNCKPRSHSVFEFVQQFENAENVLIGMMSKNNFRFRYQTDEKLGFLKLPSVWKYLQNHDQSSLVHVLEENYHSLTKNITKVSFR